MPVYLEVLKALCPGITLGRLRLPYVVPGIELESLACKVSTLPLVLFSFTFL